MTQSHKAPNPFAATTDKPDIDAIEARWTATTQGTWRVDASDGDNNWINIDDHHSIGHMFNDPDAEFVSHAHQDVPALIARVRKLEAENARLENVQRAYIDLKIKVACQDAENAARDACNLCDDPQCDGDHPG